ncbi:cupin domain-containing protein [Bordetella holmesii]|uniref:Cupin domain protein, PF06172 family n=2 Tax=Bordetella holmesii TaxID=35814 RepID=A0A158M4K1_9BORD|nr:cupin domain-containing protein [Bordetella holmesii]AHV93064.1 cupin superfamily protein [Bordetella holmesii ATCC 51541]AIT24794.1 cupin superfamily protein [Bordetella holmesii 44057]EWM45365.1 cupin superfamily protein [Bordetella holmesii 70147]EWM48796.1 cupin superfamily protein [Bordetella holmesii 41130]EWM49480.1 cupin superfamily protein [Bordetella holmesii 35009]
MTLDQPLALLGGISPDDFMRRYWQRKPLLIRQAIPGFKPPETIAALKKLARRDDVESRLIWREQGQWQMENGPFARLPKASEPDWTLLVQSVDLHSDAAAELMQRFRFIPDARLDDLMVSVASDGGGVGPHFDSYDVFLLQAAGQRRWRYGRQKDLSLEPDLPLKILSHFEPEHDVVLEAGDMLYLPPQAAHDGVAVGDDCMTISIGFRAPTQAALARGLLEAAADQAMARIGLLGGPYGEPALPGPKLDGLYRDPGQAATRTPAALPDALVEATLDTLSKLRFDDALASRFLGCWLTEPSQLAVFDGAETDVDLEDNWPALGRLVLDRRSRMLYRGKQLFINGETAMVCAEPALKQLADARVLDCADPRCKRLSDDARSCLADWLDSGWLHYRA